jgi:hypothetical protein
MFQQCSESGHFGPHDRIPDFFQSILLICDDVADVKFTQRYAEGLCPSLQVNAPRIFPDGRSLSDGHGLQNLRHLRL